MFHLLVIGFLSILGQVVILRELNVTFYGVELVYLLAFSVWLLWTAAGSFAGRRASVPGPAATRWLFIAFAVLVPADVIFLRGAHSLLGGVPGAYLPLGLQMAVLVLSLLFPGLCLGLLFQWAAKRYIAGERTLASAYAVESVGGLAGGLAATLFLKAGLQNWTGALLAALAAVAAAAAGRSSRHDRAIWVTSGVLGGILLASISRGSWVDSRLTAWNHPQIVETRDSPYGRVTLTSRSGQVCVFENDALSFETEGTGAEEFAHLAALQHPAPKSFLVLGGGVEGIVGEVLKHAPRSVTYVELNPVLLDLALRHLPAESTAPLSLENVRVTVADPRKFLGREGLHDVVLVGMPEPASGQSSRFFTREFFKECAERLAPGGIVAFRLPSAENIASPQMVRRLSSICLAARESLPHVIVLPGSVNIVLASKDLLVRDPDVLAERFKERKIAARLVSPPYIRYLFTNDRFFSIEKAMGEVKVPANSDAEPICYQYTVLIWLSKFWPSAAFLDLSPLLGEDAAAAKLRWCLFFCLMAAFFASRLLPRLRRTLLAGVAGFTGMGLETILILHYQMKSGVLYQDIGLLLTVFMGGLALGSVAPRRLVRKSGSRYDITVGWGGFVAAAFAVLAGYTAAAVARGWLSSLWEVALALGLAGFLVAGMFAYASLREIEDQKAVVSPLYAADLIGGSVAALAGSLFLIPMVGLAGTASAMLFVGYAAILLL
jgi:spermidine synthase